MSRTIQLDIPDPVYEAVARAARADGTTAEEWILTNATARLPSAAQRPSDVPVTGERAANRFRSSFGTIDSGNPQSADNEAIDADLARAFGETTNGEQ